MRKRFLAAAATLAIGAAVAGTWLQVADAQTPPPPADGATAGAPPQPAAMGGPMAGAMSGPMAGAMSGPGGHPWMRPWMAHMPWARGPGGPEGRGGPRQGGGMRQWGLIFTPADRQLTPADVQKIAEGFLLWHGNHAWKVTDVSQNSDGSVGFAFATQDGGVIARFTMDAHTGRVKRSA